MIQNYFWDPIDAVAISEKYHRKEQEAINAGAPESN